MRHFGKYRQPFSLVVLGLLTLLLTLTQTPAIASYESILVAQGMPLQPAPVIAQFAPPSLSLTDSFQPPSNVTQIGGIEVASVKFQGDDLFTIASSTVLDRKNPGNQIPVEARAKRIQENLQYIIAISAIDVTSFDRLLTTVYDAKTLAIQVATLSNETVLTATDASRTQRFIVMTVTEQDAEYNGLSKAELAQQWRDRLQTALVAELNERSPAQLLEWCVISFGLILLLVLSSAIPWLMLQWLNRSKRRLKAREAETALRFEAVPASETSANRRFEFLRGFRRHNHRSLQLSLIEIFRLSLIWIMILIWVVGIGLLIDKFPFIPLRLWDILILPLEILFIWFVAGIVNSLGDFVIQRSAVFWATHQVVAADLQRRSLRVSTIAHVLKGLKTFLVYLIAVLWTLRSFDFNTGSILAFGAIVGFAISLASQSLIRDLVNGFLILLEDQYAIGDVIAVDTATGVVESLNLRTTQLRNAEGHLIVLPNSTINRVENLTRTWSRVDHTIEVAASTNADQALRVIQAVAQGLYDDPALRSLILEPPEVLGIDRVSHAGILIHTQIKTQPLQQWKVGRAFRLRLKNALDEHQIALGMPQQQVWNYSGKTLNPDDQRVPASG
ncbi:MAG: mechanosensitive ion channel family protein [Tildeniella nuda ZEHNDER 1965/U140]|jgi:small conductance mechanosensitive channel|nr:mechanosensitive ion channel family protein [Tildeniella nuda ZEHNDER 1965/U140]